MPLRVIYTVAVLYWCRYQVLPDGEYRESHLQAATELFSPILEVEPTLVPDDIRRGTTDDGPAAWAAEAARILSGVGHAGDPSALEHAVGLLQRAVLATPAEHTDRPVYLCNLGMALMRLYKQDGDPAKLEEAIKVGHEAVSRGTEADTSWPMYLSNLGGALQARYLRDGAPADLDEAIELSRLAVAATSADHPDRPGFLSNLVVALRQRCRRDGNPADLDEAIEVARAAMRAAPAGHSDRVGWRSQLAAMLADRCATLVLLFTQTDTVETLGTAIESGREAVQLASDNFPVLTALTNLSAALLMRFESAGRLQDLNEAAEVSRQAIRAIQPSHQAYTGILGNRARILAARYRITQTEADLGEAIELWQSIAWSTSTTESETGRDPSERVEILADLSLALRTRFERSYQEADIEEAIAAAQESAAVAVAATTGEAHAQTMLAAALGSRYRRRRNVVDLDEAISLARRAVSSTPPEDQHRSDRLTNLAVALQLRFENGGDPRDLDEAVQVGSEAVEAAGTGHGRQIAALTNLGAFLRIRFESAGAPADLRKAIDITRRALDIGQIGATARAKALTNLGGLLQLRFESTDSIQDLDDAIAAQRSALEAAPAEGADRPIYLSNLCLALQLRFLRLGAETDLNEAISAGVDAATATPEDDPSRAPYLNNLALAYRRRFEHHGSRDDLDAALAAGSAAVNATPTTAPTLPRRLSNLSALLQLRYEATGATDELNNAVRYAAKAVEAGAGHRPEDAGYLRTLAGALGDRYQATGVAADLDAAIEQERRALDGSATGDPHRASSWSNLSIAFLSRFALTESTGDLRNAIDAARTALMITPSDHPQMANRLAALGNTLWLQAQKTRSVEMREEAIATRRRTVAIATAPPYLRLAAARSWGEMGLAADDPAVAVDGYVRAVALLPRLAWHGLDRRDRQQHLAACNGLAADAALAAIHAGEPKLAIELLDQGRSVLWSQLLQLRGDMTELADQQPSLAARLEAIRHELDATPTVSAEPALQRNGPYQSAWIHSAERRLIERRMDLASEWDQIVAQVRQFDGFANFLTPIPYEQLRQAAAQGPVVLVNVSRYGCHALAVTNADEDPRVIDLPRLTYDGAVEWVATLTAILERTGEPNRPFLARERDRHTVFDLLEWLWDAVASPVLQELDSAAAPGNRVWWCPTGPLALLPLHAAGRHQRTAAAAAGESVSSRVISSYTPTLGALLRAATATPAGPPKQLVVGLPNTPGHAKLPAVPRELKVIERHFAQPDSARHLVGSEATRETVAALLPAYSWLHMACHAERDRTDPTRSGFALWGDDGNLTVADLTARPEGVHELAFLSACETGAGDELLPDESIHLAAVMQLVGFRQVVATMWTIADSPAPDVAETFYRGVSADGGPNARHAAAALHAAMETLRSTYPSEPLRWAAYLHVGP